VTRKKKLTAVFEVKFDPDMMIDDEGLRRYYDGSWLQLMRFLYNEEGMGIFAEPIKLVEVKE
jgi:hypothetical protein